MSEAELKEAIDNKNVIIGSREVLKSLKAENVKSVFIANNCPENTKNDIARYANLAKIPLEELEKTGKEVGVFSGKPFGIVAIAIKK
jgi:large subunit ribosomal protein L30e